MKNQFGSFGKGFNVLWHDDGRKEVLKMKGLQYKYLCTGHQFYSLTIFGYNLVAILRLLDPGALELKIGLF
jgi:hypothetical protein